MMNTYLQYKKSAPSNVKYVPSKLKERKINMSTSSINIAKKKTLKSNYSFSIGTFPKEILFISTSPKQSKPTKYKKISHSMNTSKGKISLISKSSNQNKNNNSVSKSKVKKVNLSLSTYANEIRNKINNNIIFNYSSIYTHTNPNNNSTLTINPITNKKEPTKLSKNNQSNKENINCLNEIEKKFDKEVSSATSKSKKYNIIKGLFEDAIKFFPQSEQNILFKFLMGYHEIVYDYAKENKKLKEINETTTNNLLITDKNLLMIKKQLKEKQKELDIIKHSSSSNYATGINTNPSFDNNSNSTVMISSLDKSKNIKERVDKVNKRNVEDLDALYFTDKVKMETQSDVNSMGNRVNKTGEVIPFLDIQSEYNEEDSRCNEV